MTVVFTIGYEGSDIDRFVQTLKAARIQRLADVRAVAVSRKAGFSKRRLAERLASEGVEYEHFVALGDPKPGREAARAGHYELFRSIYGAHMATVDAQASFGRLVEFIKEGATCLLCFERDPRTCHRTIVASKVIEVTGFELCNLFADDPERYVRHASKLPRFHTRESAPAA